MTTQDLGARIRAARQAAGLSQEKLAERLGLTRQAVTKWETGQSAPSTENLLRLAEVLGVPVSTLLDEAAPQPPGHPLRILSTREFMQVLRGNLRAALIILACWVLLYLAGGRSAPIRMRPACLAFCLTTGPNIICSAG